MSTGGTSTLFRDQRKYTLTWLDNRSYLEGIVRGYRNNLLNGQHYGNLTQCDTIDGPAPTFRFFILAVL
jgi:hypothetical protein